MHIRKNYRNLSDVERDRLTSGLMHLKTTGVVDRFAAIHRAHASMGIHRSAHFLPWHREFILRFEQELQRHHPDITLPYWDSSVDQSPADPLWQQAFLGQFDGPWRLNRALGADILPTPGQVAGNLGRPRYQDFWPELEVDIHNPPHRWVGGVMASSGSPGDPVFFLQHAWIDLLWVQWQQAQPGAAFVGSGPGLGLNDPLMEWPDRTPADVLDHRALGYTYDIEPGIAPPPGAPVGLGAPGR